MAAAPPPGRYEWLDFNAPMSSELAHSIATSLARHSPARVLDIGCGWGELLLRVLGAAPTAQGIGVDNDAAALSRGRHNATARGLGDRVRFQEHLPVPQSGPADVVICVGADHVFGTQADALRALHPMVNAGGRLLFGSGFWEVEPTVEQAGAVGAEPGELGSLADLVDLATEVGFRPLDLRTATRREWERFESGYLADWEEWLMRHAGTDGDAAAQIRERADTHRAGYLRGYRGVLGFAGLTLGRPR